jgi:ribonuclease HI
MLLQVPGHSGTQDNEDADASARKGSSNPFLGPEATTPIKVLVSSSFKGGW